jgi:hypothetical protein
MLAGEGVSEVVITYLKDNGCNSVAAFHNWVDTISELKLTVLAKTSAKDDVAQLAYLKQAW